MELLEQTIYILYAVIFIMLIVSLIGFWVCYNTGFSDGVNACRAMKRERRQIRNMYKKEIEL